MTAGRALSVAAVIAAGLCSGLSALILSWSSGGPGGAALWALGATALSALVAALVMAPMGVLLDRELGRVRELILSAAQPGSSQSPVRTHTWLKPLVEATQEALEGLRQRCEERDAHLREMEIRLRVSEAERMHVEAVLQSLHDAVIVTDGFNELKMANERAAQLLGFELPTSIHRPLDEIVHDDHLRRLIREALDASTPSHRKHIEHSIPGAAPTTGENGETSPTYDVTLSCLPDPQKGVGGVVTILRDITREREINQMKSEFVSKASHELRTPLSSINAYVELLLDGEADDESSRQEFYTIIKSEADRLGRLIDNMLNISRIEAGIIKINVAEVDFVKAVHRAVEVIQPQAKLKEITINVQHGPLAYIAMGDEDMMHQVLLNLLSNAVKYTPEGGRVTVNIENDDATSSVMVTVADTGLGIPPDSIDKIFEKFYRIENYKRVAKGTGLGLNLVKHIVETVHFGQVSVSSQLGMGSKFTITIPYRYEGA